MSKHDPLGHDRPRMAEALASLKDGLGESDDPFYDGWKRRKGAGDAADNLRALQVERDTIRTEPLLAPDADTQEMRRDDLTDVEVEIPVTEGELEGEPGPGTAPAHDTIEARLDLENLEEQLLDTVAVRVIRYRAFPRWALILAVSLLLFAASVGALLLGLRANVAPKPVALPSTSTSPQPVAPPASVSALAHAPLAAGSIEASERRGEPSPATSPKGARTRIKEPKPKPSDPAFFRDPGF